MSTEEKSAEEIYSDRRETLIALRKGMPVGDYVNFGFLTTMGIPDAIRRDLLPSENNPILCEFCPHAAWTGGLWFLQARCTRLHELVYKSSHGKPELGSARTHEHLFDDLGFGVIVCGAYEEAMLALHAEAEEAAEKQRQRDAKANYRAEKAARVAEGDPLVGFEPASSSVGAPLWEEDDDSR